MSLNTLSANHLVHVIIIGQHGKRSWFHHTNRRRDDKTGTWHTLPVVDDDPHGSNPMTLEIALISQRRWRELGIDCRFALEPNGTYIDPDPKSESGVAPPWEHRNCLVTVTQDGQPTENVNSPWVYEIKAVNTPELGRAFVLKFGLGVLQNQSQFSSFEEGPDACVRKAFERGFTKLEKPIPNPHLEFQRREAERRILQQASRPLKNLRPGDR